MQTKQSNDSASGRDTVAAFLAAIDHAAKQEIVALRRIILDADASIAAGIKWNAPSFRTTEYFATFNLRAKEGTQLILHFGAKKNDITNTGVCIPDPEGLLKWLAKDRATVSFCDMNDIVAKKSALVSLIRQWIKHV